MSLPAISSSQRIVKSLPFVEALARRMASSMPHSIDVGDRGTMVDNSGANGGFNKTYHW